MNLFFETVVNWKDLAVGGAALAFLAGLSLVILLFLAAIYVYTSLAWMKIAQKRKYKYPWLAWIPFANIAMILQLGSFHWAWIFLFLIPIIGWIILFIFFVIANWRIFESLGSPGWLSLLLILGLIPKLGFIGYVGYLLVIGIVAWGKEDVITEIKQITGTNGKKKSSKKTAKSKSKKRYSKKR